ncbi:3915_t:CDS:2 [Dentiscutata erythropus]|uniref:3915_t:CDS:1 n=1 Tax=Dentiscutata erythropus TaxID=1348616 RepID=A0A9N9GR92_9GLOM|nr:3915_t:CDS:2 [Dentiscutata erythropus]
MSHNQESTPTQKSKTEAQFQKVQSVVNTKKVPIQKFNSEAQFQKVQVKLPEKEKKYPPENPNPKAQFQEVGYPPENPNPEAQFQRVQAKLPEKEKWMLVKHTIQPRKPIPKNKQKQKERCKHQESTHPKIQPRSLIPKKSQFQRTSESKKSVVNAKKIPTRKSKPRSSIPKSTSEATKKEKKYPTENPNPEAQFQRVQAKLPEKEKWVLVKHAIQPKKPIPKNKRKRKERCKYQESTHPKIQPRSSIPKSIGESYLKKKSGC